MMRLTDIELAGRRVLRAGVVEHVHNGETDRRVILSLAWRDDPPIPLSSRTLTFPTAVLPAVLEELQRLQEAHNGA